MNSLISDTIAAIATPPGVGGIAIVRVSGSHTLSVVEKLWKGKDLSTPRRACFGEIVDPASGKTIDECIATFFKAPASFTGEDTVELALHGSPWIQKEVLALLLNCGARGAEPGEFTQRAFLNGKLDLAQAEGVADLIASGNRSAHQLAMSQLKGNFSSAINALRENMIGFASLLELELDFSEEDVEFADRSHLKQLCREVKSQVDTLAASYRDGNAFKSGFPVAIAGIPNAGKSTLLNRLLGEEKAIVSDIPGTTRDLIEDTLVIDGIPFRLIDTAGLRETEDKIEKIGVQRARTSIENAMILLWLIDPSQDIRTQLQQLKLFTPADYQTLVPVLTKRDTISGDGLPEETKDFLEISALDGAGMDTLKERLMNIATSRHNPATDLMVTNERHYDALRKTSESLQRVLQGLDDSISADFVAQDLREAIHHLSLLTGTISTPDLLHTIFSRFCIGK